MSIQALQVVLGRAVVDAGFRRTLFTAPEEVAQAYRLSPDEAALLLTAPTPTVLAVAAAVENWRRGALAHASPQSPEALHLLYGS